MARFLGLSSGFRYFRTASSHWFFDSSSASGGNRIPSFRASSQTDSAWVGSSLTATASPSSNHEGTRRIVQKPPLRKYSSACDRSWLRIGTEVPRGENKEP